MALMRWINSLGFSSSFSCRENPWTVEVDQERDPIGESNHDGTRDEAHGDAESGES